MRRSMINWSVGELVHLPVSLWCFDLLKKVVLCVVCMICQELEFLSFDWKCKKRGVGGGEGVELTFLYFPSHFLFSASSIL